MAASSSTIICSICLDEVSDDCGRTIVTLQCSDKFHLDCIGSAFNARGIMECPNCQAVENGVWRRFKNESPEQVQDIDQDTNNESDQELAMEPAFLTSPIHGLIVQQPSSGHLTVNDLNANFASTPNFNCPFGDPPVPGNGFGSPDINCQWNGLPVPTDPCHSRLGIDQSQPFCVQGYISTMCGHTSDSDQSLLLPATSILDPANLIESFGDPNIYSHGFDFQTIPEDSFSFAYQDGNAPICNSAQQLHLLNSSPLAETPDSMLVGIGSASDQASNSHTVPSVGMGDQFNSLAASQYLHCEWNDNNLIITISDDDDEDD